MKKIIIFLISFIMLVSSFVLPASAAGEKAKKKNSKAKDYVGFNVDMPDYGTDVALLVNADTDKVIYSKNADKITAPSSLAKLLTAVLVMSKCNDITKEFTCTKKALDNVSGLSCLKANLKEGEVISIEMLLYCMLLKGANDAVAVLVDFYNGGDIDAFVADMNSFCEKIGCTNSYFSNPYGFDDDSVKGYGGTQSKTTASDLYLIAKEALKINELKTITSKFGKTIPETNKSPIRYIYSTNQLLNNYSYYYYDNAVGLKVAASTKAGACIVSSASRDGYTYISIALRGTTNKYVADGEVWNTSFLTCRYLLRWAFNNIKMTVIADTSHNMGEMKVKYGRGADYVAMVPSENVTAVMPDDLSIENLKTVFPEDFPEYVKAPVKKGQVIGTAALTYSGMTIAEVTLVARESVGRNHLWAMFSWVEKLLSSKLIMTLLIIAVIVIIFILLSTRKKRQRKKKLKNKINVISDYNQLIKK